MSLFVFTGSNVIAVRAKAHDFLHTREVSGAAERVDAENCSVALLKDLAGGSSLFGGSETILIDTPSESAEALDALVEVADVLAESTNQFVVIEGKLLVVYSKPLKKYAQEYTELKHEAKNERFNVFALADALVRRDKKSLWVLLQRARFAGLSAEEILGTLFWQIKAMRLAVLTSSASDAGLKPFVYNKAKAALTKYSKDEIDDLSRNLVSAYHDGHLGKVNIDNALERFVLSV